VEVTTDVALYEVPSPIPDVVHGTLLKYQVVTPSSTAGAITYRVMYTSRSVQDAPIVVTGIVLVPDAPAGPDGRLTLTIATAPPAWPTSVRHRRRLWASRSAPWPLPWPTVGWWRSPTTRAWALLVGTPTWSA